MLGLIDNHMDVRPDSCQGQNSFHGLKDVWGCGNSWVFMWGSNNEKDIDFVREKS